MSKKVFCDKCGEELTEDDYLEVRCRTGMIQLMGGDLELVEHGSPYHFHRRCSKQLVKKIQEEVDSE